MGRLIKSLTQFKETVRKCGYTNMYSGKSTKDTYHLHYGFDRTINLGYSNLKDAYQFYKENHAYLDKFVAPNSFLLD